MSILLIRPPADIAQVLSRISVPGTLEDSAGYHITMVYFGDDVPVDQVLKAVDVTHRVISKYRPFVVSTSLVTTFPKGDDGSIPVICKVKSPELVKLRAELIAEYEAAGVNYNTKFPKYNPHLTLSYSQDPVEDMDIPKISWGCADIAMWAGDTGEDRFSVKFPLTLGLEDRIAQRYINSYQKDYPF